MYISRAKNGANIQHRMVFVAMYLLVHRLLPLAGVDVESRPARKVNSWILLGGILIYWLLFTNVNSTKCVVPALKHSWHFLVAFDVMATYAMFQMQSHADGENTAAVPTSESPVDGATETDKESTAPPQATGEEDEAVLLLSNEGSERTYLPSNTESHSALGNSFNTTSDTS